MKRITALFFALLLIISSSIAVFAAEEDKLISGGSGGVTWVYENGVLTVSGKGAFSGIASITDNSEDIRYVRTRTQKIIVNSGITSLGEYAFGNFTKATEISLPSTLRSIGSNAFYCCYCITSISVPENVDTIGELAFYNCRGLKTVKLPKTVDSFGKGVFWQCWALTDVTLPENITSLWNVFNECKSLKTVDIPDSVTNLSYAFSKCSSLVSVDIPDGVTNVIGTFRNCTSLKSVTLPDGATVLSGTFNGCSSLNEITIPNGVTRISYNAFTGTAIKSLKVPASVEHLGTKAFSSMPKLETLIFEGHAPLEIAEDALSDLPKLDVVNYYSSAVGWEEEICGFKTEAIAPPTGYEIPDFEDKNEGEEPETPEVTPGEDTEIEDEPKEEENLPFTDISADDEEYEAIRYVYENNLFRGTSETTFAPEVMMNRAMFVTVLGRLAGVADMVDHSVSKFTDVPVNTYYTGFVTWANSAGVVKGYGDGRFGPDDIVTVEQAVTFIYRFAGASSVDGASAPENVSGWAKDSVAWALDTGIILPEEIENPQTGSTRSLVAEMLYRLGYSEK